MNDAEAAAFYSKPENLRPGERVTPAARPRMVGHVPIRFPQETVDQIKALAAEDGDTVSTWIRKAVDRAILQRRPPQTALTVISTFTLDDPNPGTETVGVPLPKEESAVS
jgi:hypothetical protein